MAALVVYLPAIVVPYAFMDDYFILAWREGLGGEFFETATSFGRPLHALFLSGTFALASDIDSLRLVRLVSLLGLIGLAVLLYYVLRQAGFGRWLSAGACVSIVTLASVQVYISWAAIGEVPYVAILSGLAFLRLRSGFELGGRAAVIRSAEAAALLLLALLIYQPAAMFFWVFAAIDLLRPAEQLRGAWRKFGISFAVAAVAMFFAYGAVRVGVHFYGGAFSGRTNLVHDVLSKARWFWNEPVVNSLGMFGVLPTESLAAGLAIVATVGILLLHAEAGWAACGFLGLAAILILLSYLPNLAVAEEFASYRSIGALAALLTLYVWLGLWGIGRSATTVSERHDARRFVPQIVALALAALLSFVLVALVVVPLWRPRARVSLEALTSWPELTVFVAVFVVLAGAGLRVLGSSSPHSLATAVGGLALTTFAVGGVLIAARNVTTLVVKPQSIELQLLRAALDNSPQSRRVVFVKPNWTHAAAPLVRYDEFGPPSTYFAWVPNPAVLLVLRERGQRAEPAIEVLAWDQAPASRSARRGVFVDMRKLRKHRVGWSFWTLEAASRATAAAGGPFARQP